MACAEFTLHTFSTRSIYDTLGLFGTDPTEGSPGAMGIPRSRTCTEDPTLARLVSAEDERFQLRQAMLRGPCKRLAALRQVRHT